jgi:hypothetical protein
MNSISNLSSVIFFEIHGNKSNNHIYQSGTACCQGIPRHGGVLVTANQRTATTGYQQCHIVQYILLRNKNIKRI